MIKNPNELTIENSALVLIDHQPAVEATGRKKLIMAGLVTEVCLAQSVLAALKDGYEVYFVSDCSGGITREAHEDAKVRMTQAGARPVSWLSVLSEWTPDYTSAERQALTDVMRQRGGTAAVMADYVLAQVSAGLVKPPTFSSAAIQPAGKTPTNRQAKPAAAGAA